MQRRGIQNGILGILLSLSLARADTITLNNGDHLEGEVLKETEETVLFDPTLLPQPVEIPVEAIQLLEKSSDPSEPQDEDGPEEAPGQAPTPETREVEAGTAAPPTDEPLIENEPLASRSPEPSPLPPGEEETEETVGFRLPENWNGRVGLGYSDLQNESTENREVSANASLSWKGERGEAQWRGYYQYQSQEEAKSADRYGVSQRLRHRGEKGFYVQGETKAEVDNVTKNRSQLSQTAGLGYAPVKEEKLSVHLTPGFKAEHVTESDRDDEEGTAYKAHLQQDLKWKVTDMVAVGQGLSYSVDPRRSENWDMDFQAFVETQVSEDVNLRVNYRRDFLNQTEGRPDKKSVELGASLVWDF